jgi:hypothetical protein
MTAQFERLHPQNLKLLRASVKKFGTVWIHGDGNIYENKETSDIAQKFVNTPFSAPTYRAKFTTLDKLPTTLEELEIALQNGRMNEIKEEKIATTTNKLPTLSLDELEDEEEETVISEQPKRGRPRQGE